MRVVESGMHDSGGDGGCFWIASTPAPSCMASDSEYAPSFPGFMAAAAASHGWFCDYRQGPKNFQLGDPQPSKRGCLLASDGDSVSVLL
ncbi:hypothetical protein EJB05_03148 [Eragrostis curvula]|uniref:Uncharacterized protein n=1 Tax=Eragrostis curvula TaxID=38414 RepID=A0A5J9WV87_9POAL|nr:hypothetical protein EJB05_03148 [Eragrostis curvula]